MNKYYLLKIKSFCITREAISKMKRQPTAWEKIFQMMWPTGFVSKIWKHFPDSSVGKESACNAGDPGSIPGSGRSPGEGKGYPLQHSGPENSMDCIAHVVSKSPAGLSDFHFFTFKCPYACWHCCDCRLAGTLDSMFLHLSFLVAPSSLQWKWHHFSPGWAVVMCGERWGPWGL